MKNRQQTIVYTTGTTAFEKVANLASLCSKIFYRYVENVLVQTILQYVKYG